MTRELYVASVIWVCGVEWELISSPRDSAHNRIPATLKGHKPALSVYVVLPYIIHML